MKKCYNKKCTAFHPQYIGNCSSVMNTPQTCTEAKPKKKKRCEWEIRIDDLGYKYYSTSCPFITIASRDKDDTELVHKYCQYCGKKIKYIGKNSGK